MLNTAGHDRQSNPAISPDGQYSACTAATAGGQANLYLYPLEEEAGGRGGRGGAGGEAGAAAVADRRAR